MDLFDSSRSIERSNLQQSDLPNLSTYKRPCVGQGTGNYQKDRQAIAVPKFQFVQQDLYGLKNSDWRTIVRSHARKHVWDRRRQDSLPRGPRKLLMKAPDALPVSPSNSRRHVEEPCLQPISSRSGAAGLSSNLSFPAKEKQPFVTPQPIGSADLQFVHFSSSKQAGDQQHVHRDLLQSSCKRQTGSQLVQRQKSPKQPKNIQDHLSPVQTALHGRWITETQMQWISPQTFLGAGRVDPFSTYPVERTQSIDRLIDHYASVITYAWPEEPETGFSILRTKWLPLCMQGEMIFKSMILAAEINTRANKGLYPWSVYAAHLAIEVIELLNKELNKSHPEFDDMTIATVIQISGIELTFGETENYRNHMKGIEEMVKIRGGMENLGDHMQNMIIWVNQLGGGSGYGKKKENMPTTTTTTEIAYYDRPQEGHLLNNSSVRVRESSTLVPDIVKVLVSVRWLTVAKDSKDVYEEKSGFQDACFEVQHRLQELQIRTGTSNIEGGLLLAVRLYVDAVLLESVPEKIIRSEANNLLQQSLMAWRGERDLEENSDILDMISTVATVGIAPTCGLVDQLGGKLDIVLLRLESLCLD